MTIEVRPRGPEDQEWAEAFLAEHRSARVARNGELLVPIDHPALVAWRDGARISYATYVLDGDACEILTLHSAVEDAGGGTALTEAIADLARRAGCTRLWVVTTNDNTHALRFYQRRGFRIGSVRVGRVDEARRTIKPEIGERGFDDIPIRDEVELEMDL